MKECSNRWSSMSKLQRDPYLRLAKLDKIRFEKQMYTFKDSHEPEPIKKKEKPKEEFKESPQLCNLLAYTYEL